MFSICTFFCHSRFTQPLARETCSGAVWSSCCAYILMCSAPKVKMSMPLNSMIDTAALQVPCCSTLNGCLCVQLHALMAVLEHPYTQQQGAERFTKTERQLRMGVELLSCSS